MRDLLVTTHTPALNSGHAVRTYGIARALAADGGLRLLYTRFDAPEPDAAFRSIPGIELCEVVPTRGAKRFVAYGAARLRGTPEGFARGVSPELTAEVTRLAQLADCGRVIADGPSAAAALTGLMNRQPIVYNAHNIESAFRHEIEPGSRRSLQALRRFERGLLRRASESWMVSEADMALARELDPGAQLRYVPNVIDVSAITPVSPPRDAQRAIFVATFTYKPNRNGLRFLLDEVFPRVWAELPDAKLTLVGVGLELPPETDPRVEALGFVEDLGAAYADACCAVVPLLQGGGTPLKFVEALAYGLPVIATPRAAAGLQAQDGKHCLLAQDGAQFAQALVGVLRDGAPEIAREGRGLAEQRYSIEALGKLLAT